MASSNDTTTNPVSHAWILTRDPSAGDPAEPARVWGLTASERLERALVRANAGRVQLLPPHLPLPETDGGSCLLLRGDYFYDERLVKGLVDGPARMLVEDSAGESTAGLGDAVALRLDDSRDRGQLEAAVDCLRGRADAPPVAMPAVPVARPLDISPAYNATLRKHDPPFLIRAHPDRAYETENRIYASAYKGITDLVTKWVFPLPARAVTRRLARRGVRPNSVTAVSYVLTALAAWLFFEGHFALGLAAAWGMTFLDTVDGKLARCTLTSTPIGNVLDHGLDLVHPPFWWAAWAYGLVATGAGHGLGEYAPAMWIIVIGYVVGRLLEGVFMLAFAQEIFTWRPFDAAFRTIIARRNPNLLILSVGVAIGQSAAAYWAVAAWTLACIAIHVVRIAQALVLRRHGVAIVPWYEAESQPGPAPPSA